VKPDRRALEAVADALDDRWLNNASGDEMMQLIASGYFGTLPEIAGAVERTGPQA
jgi:hypothetical protein